jgi:hypothetical protein
LDGNFGRLGKNGRARGKQDHGEGVSEMTHFFLELNLASVQLPFHRGFSPSIGGMQELYRIVVQLVVKRCPFSKTRCPFSKLRLA